MSSTLQNRFGTVERLLDRYYGGQAPSSFTQEERTLLRERLLESPAYRDTKNVHHQRVSLDVRDLFLADPGGSAPHNGEFTESAPEAGNGSLFR